MTAKVAWLALLPDPVTGLDQPAQYCGGGIIQWTAPDRAEATRLIERDLPLSAFRLCCIVSVVDWRSRQPSKQRPKLIDQHRPDPLGWHPHEANPRRVCYRCGGPTGGGGNAKYCPECRYHGRRTVVNPVTIPE